MKTKCAAILLAAGRGQRLQPMVEDKVLHPIAGYTVIHWSVAAFLHSGLIDHLLIVYRDRKQQKALSKHLSTFDFGQTSVTWVQGGEERQDSVFHALDEMNLETEFVFIHDCARPLLQTATVARLYELVQTHLAVCLAHPVVDTIKEAAPCNPEAPSGPFYLRDVPRKRLWAMETPQVFRRELITEAYRQLRLQNLRVTDDVAALEASGHPVYLLQNPHPNFKLTTSKDLALVEFCLRSASTKNNVSEHGSSK